MFMSARLGPDLLTRLCACMKENRPIVFMINVLRIGGAERLVIDDINELLARGINVKLITFLSEKEGKTLAGALRIERDSWIQFPCTSVYDVRGYWRIISCLRQWKPTALITHLWFANTVGRIAGVFAGVRTVIVFEHNVYDDVKTKKQFFVDRCLQHVTSKIVAVSEAVHASLVCHGISSSKILVLHNASAQTSSGGLSKTEARIALSLRPDEFYYMYLGRLVPQKGVDLLLEAFSACPHGTLLIVGGGPEREALQKQSVSLGSRVVFLGMRTDVETCLRAADCFVLPSRYEGFGITILEAFANGLPVIASSVDGIKEIVQHGVNGWLVSPQDVAGLTHALQLLYQDADLRDRLSAQGLKDVERFGIHRHVDALLELISDPCARKK